MTRQELADFVSEVVRARGSILGCQLGAEILSKVPDLNLRLQYGGLRHFIESDCQGRVIQIGEQGGDVVYGSASATTPSGPAQRPSSRGLATEWDAFQRPGAAQLLCVDPISGQTKLADRSEAVPPPWAVVPPMTPAEHLGLAREFLPQIDAADQEGFKSALDESNYWPAWVRLLQGPLGNKYRSEWIVFRFDKIRALFLARLKTLGVEEAMAVSILARLKAAKRVPRRAQDVGSRTFEPLHRAGAEDSELRRLARTAIDSMGTDDLRRIWLPLGVIADALGRRG